MERTNSKNSMTDYVTSVMNSYPHCTYFLQIFQIRKAVKEIACEPLPFANGDRRRKHEFKRVLERFRKIRSNGCIGVLHDFSCSISAVRRLGTSERKRADIMRKKVIQGG